VAGDPHWTFLQLLEFFGPRVFFSILCGGLIGFERELKNKPAGMKTNMLICLGSTLYTSLSVLLAMSFSGTGHYADPGRLVAQIVSGIGFLGGGCIIQARGTIQGMTTAATIWIVAAIGICIGIGHTDIAIFCSFSVLLVLVATTVFEDRILGRSIHFSCEILIDGVVEEVKAIVDHSLKDHDLTLHDWQVVVRGKYQALTVNYVGHHHSHKNFLLNLWNIKGVKEVTPIYSLKPRE